MHDGTEGRAPVSSNPIPAGYPTPLTTGICGVGLTPADLTPSGGIEVTQDGAVIDKMDVSGTIKVSADNVTIRNSRVRSGGLYVISIAKGTTGTVIEDTRIIGEGDGVSAAVNGYGDYTMRRVHVSGGSDNIKAHGGVLVEDSYATGIYKSPGSHNDVVQIRSGKNYFFKRNTMIGPWKASTSVFIIQAKGGDIDNVLVEDSYLSGGGYTVYTTETPPLKLTNTTIKNNRFELDSWGHGYKSANAPGATWIGNVQLPST